MEKPNEEENGTILAEVYVDNLCGDCVDDDSRDRNGVCSQRSSGSDE